MGWRQDPARHLHLHGVEAVRRVAAWPVAARDREAVEEIALPDRGEPERPSRQRRRLAAREPRELLVERRVAELRPRVHVGETVAGAQQRALARRVAGERAERPPGGQRIAPEPDTTKAIPNA